MSDLVHSPLGAAHFVLASVMLLVGAAVLLRRKGDRTHRRLGGVYVLGMLAVNGAALPIRSLGGLTPFHYLAVVSLATVALGYAAIFAATRSPAGSRRRDGLVRAHMNFMAWSYVGLFAAGVGQVGARLGLALVSVPMSGWVVTALSIACIIGVGACLIRRHERRLALRYFPSVAE